MIAAAVVTAASLRGNSLMHLAGIAASAVNSGATPPVATDGAALQKSGSQKSVPQKARTSLASGHLAHTPKHPESGSSEDTSSNTPV